MPTPASSSLPEPSTHPSAPHKLEEVDLSCESVAGEEDPGASLDMSAAPAPATPTSATSATTQKVPE